MVKPIFYKDDFDGAQVLEELRERLGDYLPFLSTDFVVCVLCGMKLRTWDFPEHIENEHYDPPTRVWSKGPKAGWRRKWRQLERRLL